MEALFSTTMTCGKCLSKLRPLLDENEKILSWEADLADPRKIVRVRLAENTPASTVVELIAQAGFVGTQIINDPTAEHPIARQSTLLATYKPLFLVVSYVVGASILFEFSQTEWLWPRLMNNFMGFFFLGFAFFKLLDVRKFADAFASYDIVAKRSRIYALAYPFVELSLGLLFVTQTLPIFANIATSIVMAVGLVGVISAVRKQQAIQCACLGTAFNLPMSVVTIVENSVMLVMALAQIVTP